MPFPSLALLNNFNKRKPILAVVGRLESMLALQWLSNIVLDFIK